MKVAFSHSGTMVSSESLRTIYIYIYIYIYIFTDVCVCVCVCFFLHILMYEKGGGCLVKYNSNSLRLTSIFSSINPF